MKQIFLIKLSGEAMSGKLGTGLDFDYIELPNENWTQGHESLEELCKHVDQILDKKG